MSDEDDSEANAEEERIYYAITGEDSITLKNMLEDGLNPDTKFHGSNQLDKSALHLSCETGSYECAKLLLDYGANKNVLDAWYQCPLIYCISSERINMVELMLSYQASPNLKDRFGKTSVHFAVNNSDTSILQALIARRANVDIRDENGRTPLWTAVSEDGHLPHVQCLIQSGCDINLKDSREKRTPLQVAILNSNKDALMYVKRLLQAGATCNTVDQFGHTPMMSLIRRNRRKDKEHVQEEDLSIAQLLIEHRYDVNLVSVGIHWYQFRGTALKMAADRGAVTLVRLLLEAGADPDLTDDKNVTPLHLAASNNYHQVAKLLLYTNCCLDTVGEIKIERTTLSVTPFRCALLKNHLQMARLLVLSGYNARVVEGDSFRSVMNLIHDKLELSDEKLDDAYSSFWFWLLEQLTVPWCLAIQARLRIRKLVRPPIVQGIEKLPLPRWTKDYLLMKDLLWVEL